MYPEDISVVEQIRARLILVEMLRLIPKFTELWDQARSSVSPALDSIIPEFRDKLQNMSPEGRDALMVSSSDLGLWQLCSEEAVAEAVDFAKWLEDLCQRTNDVAKKEGWTVDYRSQLQAIVEPLMVPGLVDAMMVCDMKQWGLDWPGGSVQGPGRDLLETLLCRDLTGLGPSELALETPGRIRKKIRKSVAPLARHIQRYDLQQRIGLWVLNKVCGLTIPEITRHFDSDKAWEGVGLSSQRWIEQQIREATSVLGANVPTGRPKKRAVFGYWDKMG